MTAEPKPHLSPDTVEQVKDALACVDSYGGGRVNLDTEDLRSLLSHLQALEAEKITLTDKWVRAGHAASERSNQLQHALNKYAEVEAQRDSYRKALEPFAKIADHLTQSAHGPAWGFNGGVLEHEDFQRARQALSHSTPTGSKTGEGTKQ